MPAPEDSVETALDPRLAGLERAVAPPIPPAEHAQRRARAAAALSRAGHDALLVEGGALCRWLTGHEVSRSERLFAFVLDASRGSFWIAPAFEGERAAEYAATTGSDVVPWREHEHAWRPLAAELSRRGLDTIEVASDARAFVLRDLDRAHRGRVVCGGSSELLRAVKSELELGLLAAADRATRAALARAAELLEPGWSERELCELVRAALSASGLDDPWTLALFGPSASRPHGESGSRTLERGEIVLVDCGGALGGYRSDHTRTWTFGAASRPEFERAWQAVRDAQEAALEALVPGAPAGDADRAARQLLARHGFGPLDRFFTHRLGHGIGLEGHEPPYLDGGATTPLEAGMTFTDEPGVYLPGRFGLRLEDVVVVAPGGARPLGPLPASPGSPH